ncbi:MAG TPA: PilW family protein, partial [Pseudoxanthomonas sp.]
MAQGLSLIELMIAILIGSILLLGLVQIYGATRESYRLSEGMARVQENGRFALDFLQRDIRLAGHFGCVNDQARIQMEATAGAGVGNVLTSHFPAAGLLNFRFSLQGFDGPPPIVGLTPAPLANSDSIMLRFLTGDGVPVTVIDSAARTVTVDNGKWDVLTFGGVAAPDIFGIADCTYADVFAADTVVGSTVTAPATVLLSQRYAANPGGGPASLYRAEALVYYLANGTGGRPSLYRARINRNGTPVSEELVEGIDNMQIRYGIAGTNANGEPNGNVQT